MLQQLMITSLTHCLLVTEIMTAVICHHVTTAAVVPIASRHGLSTIILAYL